MSARARQAIDALSAALASERGHLLAGRYEALAAAAAARERRTEALSALDAEALEGCADSLALLRAEAARNVDLLRAALDGAAAGRARVHEIAAARARLQGYDRSGAPVETRFEQAGGRRA